MKRCPRSSAVASASSARGSSWRSPVSEPRRVRRPPRRCASRSNRSAAPGRKPATASRSSRTANPSICACPPHGRSGRHRARRDPAARRTRRPDRSRSPRPRDDADLPRGCEGRRRRGTARDRRHRRPGRRPGRRGGRGLVGDRLRERRVLRDAARRRDLPARRRRRVARRRDPLVPRLRRRGICGRTRARGLRRVGIAAAGALLLGCILLAAAALIGFAASYLRLWTDARRSSGSRARASRARSSPSLRTNSRRAPPSTISRSSSRCCSPSRR